MAKRRAHSDNLPFCPYSASIVSRICGIRSLIDVNGKWCRDDDVPEGKEQLGIRLAIRQLPLQQSAGDGHLKFSQELSFLIPGKFLYNDTLARPKNFQGVLPQKAD